MTAIGNLSDQQIIVAFNTGDEESLSYFFKLHARSLKYFAEKLILDVAEAEDIVADCFYKMWEKRAEFDTTQNIKAFLFVSCRNACLNYLRGLKRKTAAQEHYFVQLERSQDTILNEIIETEFLQILNAEIDRLPERIREVFKLIYFEGKRTDEIAMQLDVSVKTVRNQKARAVELLKTAFLKKGMSAALLLALVLFLDKH
jgi:RNA polymerase sigma-70 factor (ECF subfamily)